MGLTALRGFACSDLGLVCYPILTEIQPIRREILTVGGQERDGKQDQDSSVTRGRTSRKLPFD